MPKVQKATENKSKTPKIVEPIKVKAANGLELSIVPCNTKNSIDYKAASKSLSAGEAYPLPKAITSEHTLSQARRKLSKDLNLETIRLGKDEATGRFVLYIQA